MSDNDRIKFFSSHCWAYNRRREGLHALLGPEWVKDIDYVDYSIPRAHPVDVESDLELALEIRDRIRECDVFLVFAGMEVNNSEWVKFEVHSAFNDSCPIVAIIPNGQERLARTATKFAWRQAHWRGESVRSAIWELLPEERKQQITHARKERLRWALRGALLPSAFDMIEVAPGRGSARGLRGALHPSVFDMLDVPPPRK